MTSSNEVAADAALPRPHTVTVTVNGRSVVLADHEATGLEIKRAAIAQGLQIDEGFQLSVLQGNGRYQVVDDNEPVHVHAHQEFLAVPPDDNS